MYRFFLFSLPKKITCNPYICYVLFISMEVAIINQSPHELPQYQTIDAAGMDIRAWVSQPIVLQPMERCLVPTGLYMAIPKGYEAQIRPRSGMAIKKGITLVNAPGTIDADYRGEVKIAVINLSTEAQTIEDGERIAQMVIAKYEHITWSVAATLPDTERGSGGFGHSGVR